MNIYNDSNFASQSSLPSDANFNSITTNSIIIPAANNGDVLFANATHEIDGLAIGPANYLLQSSGSLPQWSNTINVNTVTATDYIIPGTTHGDLFTVDNSQTLERVPIGSSGQILTSNGSQFFWQNLTIADPLVLNDIVLTNSIKLNTAVNGLAFIRGNYLVSETNQYAYEAGTIGNILLTNSIIFAHVFNATAARTYKITVSAKISSTYPSSFALTANGSTIMNATYEATTCLSRTMIYTSPITGLCNCSLYGFASTAVAQISEYTILFEPYN